jgi:8-oxo-dGTP pyrophosphatase MutT (NUDIX family)
MTSHSPDPAEFAAPIRKRGVVAVIVRGETLLVIRRSQAVRAPGAYCFPGGAIEPGEVEPEAVVRELGEELALLSRPVRRLWECVTPWQVHLAWWLAEIDPAAVPVPHPAEVESFQWLAPAAIRNLPNLLASNHHFLDALAAVAFSLRGEAGCRSLAGRPPA